MQQNSSIKEKEPITANLVRTKVAETKTASKGQLQTKEYKPALNKGGKPGLNSQRKVVKTDNLQKVSRLVCIVPQHQVSLSKQLNSFCQSDQCTVSQCCVSCSKPFIANVKNLQATDSALDIQACLYGPQSGRRDCFGLSIAMFALQCVYATLMISYQVAQISPVVLDQNMVSWFTTTAFRDLIAFLDSCKADKSGVVNIPGFKEMALSLNVDIDIYKQDIQLTSSTFLTSVLNAFSLQYNRTVGAKSSFTHQQLVVTDNNTAVLLMRFIFQTTYGQLDLKACEKYQNKNQDLWYPAADFCDMFQLQVIKSDDVYHALCRQFNFSYSDFVLLDFKARNYKQYGDWIIEAQISGLLVQPEPKPQIIETAVVLDTRIEFRIPALDGNDNLQELTSDQIKSYFQSYGFAPDQVLQIQSKSLKSGFKIVNGQPSFNQRLAFHIIVQLWSVLASAVSILGFEVEDEYIRVLHQIFCIFNKTIILSTRDVKSDYYLAPYFPQVEADYCLTVTHTYDLKQIVLGTINFVASRQDDCVTYSSKNYLFPNSQRMISTANNGYRQISDMSNHGCLILSGPRAILGSEDLKSVFGHIRASCPYVSQSCPQSKIVQDCLVGVINHGNVNLDLKGEFLEDFTCFINNLCSSTKCTLYDAYTLISLNDSDIMTKAATFMTSQKNSSCDLSQTTIRWRRRACALLESGTVSAHGSGKYPIVDFCQGLSGSFWTGLVTVLAHIIKYTLVASRSWKKWYDVPYVQLGLAIVKAVQMYLRGYYTGLSGDATDYATVFLAYHNLIKFVSASETGLDRISREQQNLVQVHIDRHRSDFLSAIKTSGRVWGLVPVVPFVWEFIVRSGVLLYILFYYNWLRNQLNRVVSLSLLRVFQYSALQMMTTVSFVILFFFPGRIALCILAYMNHIVLGLDGSKSGRTLQCASVTLLLLAYQLTTPDIGLLLSFVSFAVSARLGISSLFASPIVLLIFSANSIYQSIDPFGSVLLLVSNQLMSEFKFICFTMVLSLYHCCLMTQVVYEFSRAVFIGEAKFRSNGRTVSSESDCYGTNATSYVKNITDTVDYIENFGSHRTIKNLKCWVRGHAVSFRSFMSEYANKFTHTKVAPRTYKQDFDFVGGAHCTPNDAVGGLFFRQTMYKYIPEEKPLQVYQKLVKAIFDDKIIPQFKVFCRQNQFLETDFVKHLSSDKMAEYQRSINQEILEPVRVRRGVAKIFSKLGEKNYANPSSNKGGRSRVIVPMFSSKHELPVKYGMMRFLYFFQKFIMSSHLSSFIRAYHSPKETSDFINKLQNEQGYLDQFLTFDHSSFDASISADLHFPINAGMRACYDTFARSFGIRSDIRISVWRCLDITKTTFKISVSSLSTTYNQRCLQFDSEGMMKSGFPGTTVYNCFVNLFAQLLTVHQSCYSNVAIKDFVQVLWPLNGICKLDFHPLVVGDDVLYLKRQSDWSNLDRVHQKLYVQDGMNADVDTPHGLGMKSDGLVEENTADFVGCFVSGRYRHKYLHKKLEKVYRYAFCNVSGVTNRELRDGVASQLKTVFPSPGVEATAEFLRSDIGSVDDHIVIPTIRDQNPFKTWQVDGNIADLSHEVQQRDYKVATFGPQNFELLLGKKVTFNRVKPDFHSALNNALQCSS